MVFINCYISRSITSNTGFEYGLDAIRTHDLRLVKAASLPARPRARDKKLYYFILNSFSEMKEITNLITVNTRYSKSKAARILVRSSYECLFMDFTRNQEDFIREIARGSAPELMIEEMEQVGLIHDPEDTHDYWAARPLLECLPVLGNLELYCYRDGASPLLSRDTAVRTLILTAKAKMGKIDVNEWKDVLKDSIFTSLKSAVSEAEYIAARAKVRNICLDASREVLNSLSGHGFHVKEIVVDKPCKPLDILSAKLKREMFGDEIVRDEEVEHLVREHIRFVDMSIELGYDRAYWQWSSRDKTTGDQ